MPTSDSKPAPISFAPGVSEQVADYLQAQIVDGTLVPGERIAEARITAALGVSRGPVREALQRLASRHLVVLEPRRGARVSSFDLNDVRGLFDVYSALVTRLAQRVAERVIDGDAERVLAVLDEKREALRRSTESGDTLLVLAACDAFLESGARLIGNPYLAESLHRLGPAFGRAHYVALAASPDCTERLARFVDDLLSAVMVPDPDRVPGIVDDYAAGQFATVASRLARSD